MTPSNRRRLLHCLPSMLPALSAFVLALSLGTASAQTGLVAPTDAGSASATYEPKRGQAGKDVVWIPTPQELVDEMLRMAEITPQDYLVDLGSGDGRTVITAAQRGTRAHGIEFNPDMVELSRRAAREAGVADRATFVQGDIFESDFSDATVVTLFLLPDLNLRLRPALLEMKPGTRVVSNSFDMGDWEPDETADGGADCRSYCRAYKWIVPAKVEGRWKLDDGALLVLEQRFQKLGGHLAIDGMQHPVSDAAMRGTQIAFSANGQRHTGEVDGGRITGRDGGGKAWSAVRER